MSESQANRRKFIKQLAASLSFVTLSSLSPLQVWADPRRSGSYRGGSGSYSGGSGSYRGGSGSYSGGSGSYRGGSGSYSGGSGSYRGGSGSYSGGSGSYRGGSGSYSGGSNQYFKDTPSSDETKPADSAN